jgi:hypothetical protein
VSSILPFTRAVFVAGVCLTAGTGIGLYAVPGRTADYWAWEIKSPLTAAFFGAGYIGAGVSLFLAARSRSWERTRVVAVAALTLTSLALLATLVDLRPFQFGAGGLTEAAAWIWLAVYVALPPAVLTAFVLQERRARGAPEAGLTPPPATRLAFGAAGVVLGILGIGLLANWGWLAGHWPWPLPSLPARVMGAWLCTYAASFLWFVLRERRWERVRIGVVPAALSLALDLGAAVRFSDDLDGGASTIVYLSATSVFLLVLLAAWAVEERRGATVSA